MNKENLIVFFVTVLSGVLMVLCIHDGHDWGGDFALYIEQAQALLNSSMDRLYAINKFSTDRAYRVQGPYLYPMGFPLLLTIPYSFVGLNFSVLKIFCGLFFIGSLPLLFKLFKTDFSNALFPFAIITILAFSYEYLSFCDHVLSDLPFLFFSILTFLQMRQPERISNLCLTGILIYFSYSIRDVGIAFVPTLFVYQYSHFKKSEQKIQWHKTIPYLTFAFLYSMNSLITPGSNANHYAMFLENFSQSIIVNNVHYYADILASFLHIHPLALILPILFFLLGIFFAGKKNLHYVLFIVTILSIYLVWPSKQGIRFLFPIIPLILFFIIKGIDHASHYLKLKRQFLFALLLVYSSYLGYNNIERILTFTKTDTNLSYNIEAKKMYSYISKNIDNCEIIAFEKPRILRLFTGHNSILSDLSHFDSTGLNYLLIRKEDITSEEVIKYKMVFETSNLLLVKR